MIVKWKDGAGTSFFDYVVQVSKLDDDHVVTMTQATLDGKLIGRTYKHGNFTIISDSGTVVEEYHLGSTPNELGETSNELGE